MSASIDALLAALPATTLQEAYAAHRRRHFDPPHAPPSVRERRPPPSPTPLHLSVIDDQMLLAAAAGANAAEQRTSGAGNASVRAPTYGVGGLVQISHGIVPAAPLSATLFSSTLPGTGPASTSGANAFAEAARARLHATAARELLYHAIGIHLLPSEWIFQEQAQPCVLGGRGEAVVALDADRALDIPRLAAVMRAWVEHLAASQTGTPVEPGSTMKARINDLVANALDHLHIGYPNSSVEAARMLENDAPWFGPRHIGCIVILSVSSLAALDRLVDNLGQAVSQPPAHAQRYASLGRLAKLLTVLSRKNGINVFATDDSCVVPGTTAPTKSTGVNGGKTIGRRDTLPSVWTRSVSVRFAVGVDPKAPLPPEALHKFMCIMVFPRLRRDAEGRAVPLEDADHHVAEFFHVASDGVTSVF